MCQKRIKKVKKGSQTMRLREARRQERLQRINSSPAITMEFIRNSLRPAIEQQIKSRVLMELTWKTVALMHKNKIIQEKIAALKKETTEFVATVLNNPENKQRCLDNLKLYGSMASDALVEQQHILTMRQTIENSQPFKLEVRK